jgi:hypothetical protein
MEIVRSTADLDRTVYQFYVTKEHGGIAVYLDVKLVQCRPTRRHGWRTVEVYSRLPYDRHLYGDATIVKDEPAVPDDVREQALEQVRATVQFRPWKMRHA